ncbi:glyoxylate/hydroxypyruvate reductase A [Youhaiella tibetensis]|uniref:Glyoxylate/hydroxypyruvate reductase A n=1 Tax=Paradevosia tibetensis TaxID=1447062 RepID=A0A5B9DJF0_9HYPH|nr:glyoxylate/hydroxypyruvate reductase A [Youhaiella tibetensis]QEE18952.1 glyoxylate/hydroxypyruvate reductase A [Youhaiella tibetensis]GGF37716.1 glyoxylate/hydroxypyruvate reductase A [Youhaiella tibetensis]
MLLLHLSDVDEANWARKFREALGDYPVVRRGDDFDPKAVRYIFVWKPKPDAFDGLDNLKAVLSLGAGVDALLRHPRLPRDVPVVRFVDEDLSQKMTDYVVAQVAMHHRLHSRYAADQKARRWVQLYPPAAHETSVGIMGMGVLGQHAAERLKALGYSLRSWSRTPKDVEGVEGFAGEEGFGPFLAGTDILVNLLPLTPETQGILNYETFARLRRKLDGGPAIVNAARGGHQKEDDIVRALEDGTLGAASLDVFQVEPLPTESPLWTAPNCYITPHIAAISNEQTGVRYFSRILLDHEAGKPLVNVVDMARGY